MILNQQDLLTIEVFFINELIVFRNNHRIVVGGGREAALLVEVPDAAKFGALRASAAVGREAMRAQEDV